METKQCSICGNILLISEFYKEKKEPNIQNKGTITTINVVRK